MTHVPDPTLPSSAPRPAKSRGVFRAFWRWHFYASFLVIPVMLLLAITGSIYLLRFQIEPLMHADVMTVTAPEGAATVPYTEQLAAVEKAFPGETVASMTEPRSADRSSVFSLETADGATRDAFVNPYTGEVLGSLNPDTTLSGAAIRLHGDLMVGPWGDYLIELAACWGIVMAITGYVLFFKGRAARLRRIRSKAKGAVMRHRHGAIGAVAGVGLLGLLITGLPWTGFWGERVQTLATDRGTSLWGEDPGALSNPASTLDESLPHSHSQDVPWALGDTAVPRSNADGGDGSVADLDTAVAVASDAGLRRPLTVALPAEQDGVFSTIGYAFNDPGSERTVHVDRYGGQVVATYGYADYPLLAKTVSQGIALHEGRRFGTLNLIVMLLFCLAVIALCVTGPLMWWRRRPSGSGSLGAPRGRMPLRATPLLAVGLVALCLLLPLFGLSVVVLLLIDQLVLRRVPALGAWFSTT